MRRLLPVQPCPPGGLFRHLFPQAHHAGWRPLVASNGQGCVGCRLSSSAHSLLPPCGCCCYPAHTCPATGGLFLHLFPRRHKAWAGGSSLFQMVWWLAASLASPLGRECRAGRLAAALPPASSQATVPVSPGGSLACAPLGSSCYSACAPRGLAALQLLLYQGVRSLRSSYAPLLCSFVLTD